MLKFLSLYPNDKSLVDERLRSIKAGEYQSAFAQTRSRRVARAADIARTECEFTPTIAKLSEIMKREETIRPSDRYRYTPPHGRGPSPEYLEWKRKDKILTAEAIAKAKHLPPEDSAGFKSLNQASRIAREG